MTTKKQSKGGNYIIPMIVIFSLTVASVMMQDKQKYDCSSLIAGWHPDAPTKVIDACRNKQSKSFFVVR